MKLSVQHLARTLKTIDEPANEQLKRFEHSMIEQIDALSQVASDFSDFAKIDQTNRSLFDVNELLRSVCDLHQTSSLHPIKYNTLNHSVLISADKDQWTRVFNNLIKNALQASEGVTAMDILVSLTEEKGKLLFCIQDHGKGIAQDVQSKIFTPNFTTKTEGTGLGLSIVKKIVENHSGKIWFTSSVEEGTCFYIEIPV